MKNLSLTILMALALGNLLPFAAVTAAAAETDCRQGKILLNLNDETSKEGFVRAWQILAATPMRDSIKIDLPAMDPRTGERPILRESSFTLFDAFPSATFEWKEKTRLALNAAAVELAKIPGVQVSCGKLPAGTEPRMSGGF